MFWYAPKHWRVGTNQNAASTNPEVLHMNARTFAYHGFRLWLPRLLSPHEKSPRVALAVMVIPSHTVAAFWAEPGASVRVIGGEVWLTEEGSDEDVCLSPGQAFCLRGTGKVVLEGCRGTSICRIS